MADIAIRVDGISKKYQIGKLQSSYSTLREFITDTVAVPFRRMRNIVSGHAYGAAELDETIWALRNVSFEVERGEVVGIIGRNGAGKSTLLKILTRITEPTEGYADIYGRVGSLLEVGTGFHAELTGRENIFLNGSILGMRRPEIIQKFDEIVAFSEVEKFIDTPVKHYSSGMYLRLAFAVAAHMEPEILLVDEVLAVGDAAFQRKCLGKMENVAKEGRTVLFVSHSMGAITQLCGRTLWMEDGRLKGSGPSAEMVSSYLSSGTECDAVWTNPNERFLDKEVRLISARILSMDDEVTSTINYDTDFRIEILYDVSQNVRDLSVTFHLFDSQGILVFESMDSDMPEWRGKVRDPGLYRAVCNIPGRLLRTGRYFITVCAFIPWVKIIEEHERVLAFHISETGCKMKTTRRGVIAPQLKWNIEYSEKLV
jgi:lipopolysaccharide transport system ATP-binding protein